MWRLIPCILSSVALTYATKAQWSTDPTNNLIVGYGLNPEIASDGAGGCYITYEQNLGYPRRLMLERLNRYGYKPWGTSRRILGVLPDQSNAKITEDGDGGVIVSYHDYERIGWGEIRDRLRVQRVDSSGNFLWGTTGVRVTLSETNQGDQAIVSDSSGGCIVAWVDTLGDLRINRINSQGVRTWGDSGMYVWNSPAMPLMSADGQQGCILVFGASRVQRLDPSGMPLWGPSGVQLENIGISKLIPDGSGGVVVAGMKFISYNNGDPLWAAKAQRLDSAGHILWGSNGLTLEDSLHGLILNPPGVDLARNPDGSVTIAWGRRTSPGILDLQTQIVQSDGNMILPSGGVPVSGAPSSKGLVGVLPSDSMTSIYVWGDNRVTGGTYAQKLDTLGEQQWDSADVAVSFSLPSNVVTDGNGGFIAIVGGQNFAIRAQQVSKNGNLGEVITSTIDFDFQVPHEFILHQNYPNPFNPETHIPFELAKNDHVRLVVYDLLGREVATLVSEFKIAGRYDVTFAPRNLASGVYLYSLQAGSFRDAKKLLLIR